ncbi:protein ANTAGONIST OF LIKE HETEROCHROMATIN PROTEIN 1-like isoform X2 [Lucilia cuprina]|nr:protein ANTAGONIST OF LIKE HETEROCHROMATIN PROTEIN 1-like isoform X2 [Lucilia cuprina]
MNMLYLSVNRRSVHLGLPKSTAWNNKVPNYFDDNRFNRLLPSEFAYILDLIEDDDVFNTKWRKTQFPIELQLKIVLFRLGDGGSVRKVASIFGIGDGGTIQKITKRVFKAILKLKNKFLYWPSETERMAIILKTQQELPGCIGYIDGSEIKLAEAPHKNHELYFSRKTQYAIKVQAVCDYKLSIRQVTIGYPGSVHDAKIFLHSPLAKHPERYFSSSQWLSGDSAYPLKNFLITPFKRNSSEHTLEEREKFNKYFSKYRVRIENCFGLLKEKFGSLKELKFRMLGEENKKECNDWIMVCCILHNIVIELNIKNISENVHSNFMPQQNVNNRNDLFNFIQNT